MSCGENQRLGGTHLPTVEAVMASPTTSFWLQRSLQTALMRDPVDAVNDAEVLFQLLNQRLEDILPPR